MQQCHSQWHHTSDGDAGDGYSSPTAGLVTCSETSIRQPSLSFHTENQCVVLFSKDFRTQHLRCAYAVGIKEREQSP